MAGITDVNIVLGQADSIKEVHNVRKEQLEMNQQFIAQEATDKKIEEKVKVQELDTEDRVEIKGDQEGNENREGKEGKKDSQGDKKGGKSKLSKGTLINIKV